MAELEVLPACLVAMDQTQASKASLLTAVAAVERGKQVGALVLQVVVLVKTRRQHLVRLRRDLPEQLGQAQMLQLAPVAVAARVQLEYVDSFIRNIRVINAPPVVTVAMDFNIQFLDLRCITAVAAVAAQTTTPIRQLILDMAVTVAAVTEQMQI
jgi:hypothetical protein